MRILIPLENRNQNEIFMYINTYTNKFIYFDFDFRVKKKRTTRLRIKVEEPIPKWNIVEGVSYLFNQKRKKVKKIIITIQGKRFEIWSII